MLILAVWRRNFLLVIIAIRPAANQRCRWGERLNGHPHGTGFHGATTQIWWRPVVNFTKNRTTEADCKSSCDANGDCKSLTICNLSVCLQHSRGAGGYWMAPEKQCTHMECNEQPNSLIVLALLLAAFAGAATAASVYCMVTQNFFYAVVVSLFVSGATILLGLMPILVSPNPQLCAELEFRDTSGDLSEIAFFPVFLIGTTGSLIGSAIACTKVGIVGWQRLKRLSKIGLIYMTAATILNVAGTLGAMLESCTHVRAHQLLTLWVFGTLSTNLLLQKLLIVRANLVSDDERILSLSRKVFFVEIAAVFLLLLVLCVGLILGPRSVDMIVWDFLNSMAALLIFVFVIGDLAFSIVVSIIIAGSLERVRSSCIASNLSSGSALAHAMAVARWNLVAIVVSCFTTTMLYSTMIFFLAGEATALQSKKSRFAVLTALCFSWLLDSLSNDVCAIFVAFGSTDTALEVIGAAHGADAIGNPASLWENDAVIGHVVAPNNPFNVSTEIGKTSF